MPSIRSSNASLSRCCAERIDTMKQVHVNPLPARLCLADERPAHLARGRQDVVASDCRDRIREVRMPKFASAAYCAILRLQAEAPRPLMTQRPCDSSQASTPAVYSALAVAAAVASRRSCGYRTRLPAARRTGPGTLVRLTFLEGQVQLVERRAQRAPPGRIFVNHIDFRRGRFFGCAYGAKDGFQKIDITSIPGRGPR